MAWFAFDWVAPKRSRAQIQAAWLANDAPLNLSTGRTIVSESPLIELDETCSICFTDTLRDALGKGGLGSLEFVQEFLLPRILLDSQLRPKCEFRSPSVFITKKGIADGYNHWTHHACRITHTVDHAVGTNGGPLRYKRR